MRARARPAAAAANSPLQSGINPRQKNQFIGEICRFTANSVDSQDFSGNAGPGCGYYAALAEVTASKARSHRLNARRGIVKASDCDIESDDR
jgi:hypothetical protein